MVPQREFKQRRAAATYEALLTAAARVFGKRGFDAAQTPEIAAEAGVSTGAFYRYFTDKRAIFVEVVTQHLAVSQEEVMERLNPERFSQGSGERQAIDMVVDVLFDRVRKDAALERVYLAMSYSDPDVMRLRAEYEARGFAAMARLIELVVPRSRVPDALAAARVIGIAGVEVASDRAGLRPRAGEAGSDAAVKAALGEMVYRYLFASESSDPGKRANGPVLKPKASKAPKARPGRRRR